MRAGNAAAVTMTINGITIGRMGASGQVVEWRITPPAKPVGSFGTRLAGLCKISQENGSEEQMAGDSTFDVVSDFDQQELVNALDQVRREIGTRYDFKGSQISLELGKDGITLLADDEFRAKAVRTWSSRRRCGATCRSRSSTGASSNRPRGHACGSRSG